jgi:hypothetical protein
VIALLLSKKGGRLFPERGDAMITYSELFQLGMLIIAIIGLCRKHKKK